MLGPKLLDDQRQALASWLYALPAPTPETVLDGPAALRGRELFTSAAVGCSGCHSGASFTNNATVDVGTGGKFQVPSLLGVAMHAPYLHDGCATTLLDRSAGAEASIMARPPTWTPPRLQISWRTSKGYKRDALRRDSPDVLGA